MSGDSRADQPVVITQHTPISILTDPLEQRRRALDIREQEGQSVRARSLRKVEPLTKPKAILHQTSPTSARPSRVASEAGQIGPPMDNPAAKSDFHDERDILRGRRGPHGIELRCVPCGWSSRRGYELRLRADEEVQ